jgi:hypothetical protein
VPTKEELKKDTIDTYTNTGGTGNTIKAFNSFLFFLFYSSTQIPCRMLHQADKACSTLLRTRLDIFNATNSHTSTTGKIIINPRNYSWISKSWVMRAVLPSMIEAEQYLSADRLMALATFLSFKSVPLIIK